MAVHLSIYCYFDSEKQAWHPKTNTWDMVEWSLLLKESLETTEHITRPFSDIFLLYLSNVSRKV